MKLNLDRDLCFFDLETTGTDVATDRIVQIAIIKYPKEGGEPLRYNQLINPEYPIKPEAAEVHGLTEEKLKDQPTFRQVAKDILDFMGDADLAGYNSNRFDIPVLLEAFARVGMQFPMEKRRTLDMLQIFYKMEPRTLAAALKFYCGKKMEDAHDAMADTQATAEVFFGQLEKYKDEDYIDADDNVIEKPIRNDIQAIHDFTNDGRRVDFTQRFVRDEEGNILINFGKHRGQKAIDNPNFLRWIIDKDFPQEVKAVALQLLEERINNIIKS